MTMMGREIEEFERSVTEGESPSGADLDSVALALSDEESSSAVESLSEIPQKIFFRIGEVAKLLDVKPSVLRFWETEFPFIHPTKSASGHRVYRRKEVEKLFTIKRLLYVERFSIEGAKRKMKELKKAESRGDGLSKTGEAVLSATQVQRLRALAEKPITELFKF